MPQLLQATTYLITIPTKTFFLMYEKRCYETDGKCFNDTGFPYLLNFFTFSIQIKMKMCRMYSVFHIFFENIQYYFTEFNMVQELKYTNKVTS